MRICLACGSQLKAWIPPTPVLQKSVGLVEQLTERVGEVPKGAGLCEMCLMYGRGTAADESSL